MSNATRRDFLQQTGLGLAGLGVGGLVLRAGTRPTLATVGGDEANRILIQMGAIPKEATPAAGALKLVTPVSYGPWYKPGSPFRAKLSVPGEPGTTFVLSGRAWAFDTKRPLPGVVLDLWHVDTNGKYSDGVTDFRNRGRLISSEAGYYEVEGIRPIPYRSNPNSNFWRCAHFHLLAVCPGYKPLVTEIHFKDDPRKSDSMYRPENAIAPVKRILNGVNFETGVFDIVLERETASS
ncbi:MAG: twin-arginine translocation signal domain-containing protein [Pyrinomonadaceae bacterium]|nr:twin-arginine translocation signal domain-containing protein [Pyrinomonadaceae bacterium]